MFGHAASNAQSTSDQPAQHGRRGAARARLALPARAISFNGTTKCMILDVSQTGAQIGCEELPRVGSMIVIEYEAIEFFGTVCWTQDQRFGIHFDVPLPFEQVVELRHAADGFDQMERRRLLNMAKEFVTGNV